MKQKLAIACGLLHSPQVILFDEPLTGLDPIGIRRMKETIRQRARDGAAILISSICCILLEEICSHVVIVQGGRKIVDGPLDEVVRRFAGQAGELDLEEVFFLGDRRRGAARAPAAGASRCAADICAQ